MSYHGSMCFCGSMPIYKNPISVTIKKTPHHLASQTTVLTPISARLPGRRDFCLSTGHSPFFKVARHHSQVQLCTKLWTIKSFYSRQHECLPISHDVLPHRLYPSLPFTPTFIFNNLPFPHGSLHQSTGLDMLRNLHKIS